MSKIKIWTDSASDIPKETAEQLDIGILNFHILVDGVEYREREDFSEVQFYKILKEAKELPKTSQITQIEFMQMYEEMFSQGYSDIIYVSINSKGSGTYEAANLAKKIFFEENPQAEKKGFKIHIVDSKTYTMVYGFAVVEAARCIKEKGSVEEALRILDDWLSAARVYFSPYSLQYAKKSGRISAAKAFLGEMMGIKPIITFEDGVSKIIGKVRGESALIPELIEKMKKEMIPQTPYLLLVAESEERTEELTKTAQKIIGVPPEGVYRVGAAIAINAGPDLCAVVFKQRV